MFVLKKTQSQEPLFLQRLSACEKRQTVKKVIHPKKLHNKVFVGLFQKLAGYSSGFSYRRGRNFPEEGGEYAVKRLPRDVLLRGTVAWCSAGAGHEDFAFVHIIIYKQVSTV